MRGVIWLVMRGEGISYAGSGDSIYEYIGRPCGDGCRVKTIMICPNISYFCGFLAQTVLLVLHWPKTALYHTAPIETIKRS